jgi:hypothetical protein
MNENMKSFYPSYMFEFIHHPKYGCYNLKGLIWSSHFLGSFAPHFQIKLSTHGSNLNSIFVIMSELKFFLLTRVLIQNFNNENLVKFLEKNKKFHI